MKPDNVASEPLSQCAHAFAVLAPYPLKFVQARATFLAAPTPDRPGRMLKAAVHAGGRYWAIVGRFGSAIRQYADRCAGDHAESLVIIVPGSSAPSHSDIVTVFRDQFFADAQPCGEA